MASPSLLRGRDGACAWPKATLAVGAPMGCNFSGVFVGRSRQSSCELGFSETVSIAAGRPARASVAACSPRSTSTPQLCQLPGRDGLWVLSRAGLALVRHSPRQLPSTKAHPVLAGVSMGRVQTLRSPLQSDQDEAAVLISLKTEKRLFDEDATLTERWHSQRKE